MNFAQLLSMVLESATVPSAGPKKTAASKALYNWKTSDMRGSLSEPKAIALERIISRSSTASLLHAIEHLNGRFPKGERMILSSKKNTVVYLKHLLRTVYHKDDGFVDQLTDDQQQTLAKSIIEANSSGEVEHIIRAYTEI